MSPTELLEVVLTAWFAYRLVRHPRDRGLRVIVLALVAMLLGEQFAITALRRLSAEAITPGVGKVVQNCSLSVGFCAVMVFFLLSASGTRLATGPRGQRPKPPVRVWWDGALVVLVCGVLAAAVASTPGPLQAVAYPSSGRVQDAALQRPEVVVFYLVAVAYFAYAAGSSAVWAVRYGRESSVRARVGLRLVAAGMVLFALGSAARGVYVVLRAGGAGAVELLPESAQRLIQLGAVLWVLGLLVVGLAARWAGLRVWLRHRRDFHALRPLWEPLHRAFPEDALDAHTRREPGLLWRDRISPGQVHRAYWRRAVECRDGLSKLSPWLRDVGYRAQDPAEQQAAAVRRALELRAAGHEPSSAAPLLVAAPAAAETTVDTDVGELLRLARAMPE